MTLEFCRSLHSSRVSPCKTRRETPWGVKARVRQSLLPAPALVSPGPNRNVTSSPSPPHHNHTMPRLNINISYWTIGCITGASAVALGAFGAHGLKKHISDPKALKNWETAAHYQVYPLSAAPLSPYGANGPTTALPRTCDPRRLAREPDRGCSVHSRRYHVFGKLVCDGPRGTGALAGEWAWKGARSYHADWRRLLDRRMGLDGAEGQDCVVK
jgi:hypothetical protein